MLRACVLLWLCAVSTAGATEVQLQYLGEFLYTRTQDGWQFSGQSGTDSTVMTVQQNQSDAQSQIDLFWVPFPSSVSNCQSFGFSTIALGFADSSAYGFPDRVFMLLSAAPQQDVPVHPELLVAQDELWWTWTDEGASATEDTFSVPYLVRERNAELLRQEFPDAVGAVLALSTVVGDSLHFCSGVLNWQQFSTAQDPARRREATLAIYPNPSSGLVSMTVGGEYVVYDLLGRAVVTGSGNSISLPLSIPAGSYVVRLGSQCSLLRLVR